MFFDMTARVKQIPFNVKPRFWNMSAIISSGVCIVRYREKRNEYHFTVA